MDNVQVLSVGVCSTKLAEKVHAHCMLTHCLSNSDMYTFYRVSVNLVPVVNLVPSAQPNPQLNLIPVPNLNIIKCSVLSKL